MVFQNILNIKFHENPSSDSRVVPCRQTDRWTHITKLIATFCNFLNAPKNSKKSSELRLIRPHAQDKNPEHVHLKFLTSLTPSVDKTVYLHAFKLVYKPRNINVVFSQCGSSWHGSPSHQKWLWQVQCSGWDWRKCFGMSEEDGNVSSKWQEDEGTVEIETVTLIVKVDRIWHSLCIKCVKLTVKYFFLADVLFWRGRLS